MIKIRVEYVLDKNVEDVFDAMQIFPIVKTQLAFQLSAMGSPTMNFYNDAYARAGFEEACDEVRSLWLEKKRQEAIAAVPDDMVMKTAILGDEAAVRARLRQYAEVGIDILMLHPLGAEVEDRLDVLGRATELAAEASSTS